jgi:DNA replication protein DnaC
MVDLSSDAITNSDAFKEYQRVMLQTKTLQEFCDKHPTVRLMQVGDGKPFCTECTLERKQQQEQAVTMRIVEREYEAGFHGVLAQRSIWDDTEMRTASFEQFKAEQGSEAAKNKQLARHIAGRYLDRSYMANTLLTGEPGRGKTHLAVAMLNAVNDHIEPRTHCLFASVNEVVRLVKDSFNHRESIYTEKYMTHLLGSVNLLVLDDLGSESSFRDDKNEATDWVQQLLFGILNKRRGRTIITTNLNSKEIKRMYNTKLISRMFRGIKAEGNVIAFTEATTDKREEWF